MKTYNQQIEDAYTRSKRQGDLMRNREIERSSGQDRRNRYRDDRYQFAVPHERFNDFGPRQYRTDNYGYERSTLYNNPNIRLDEEGEFREGNRYGNTHGPHRGKGPRNYKRSDERIREDIIDRITDDPYIDASEVEIAVEKGEIILTARLMSGVKNEELRIWLSPFQGLLMWKTDCG